MSSFNKVIILGRLTRDPDLRMTPSGNHICKFGVATSRKFKLSDGSMKEETTFIDIDAFGKQAEVVSKFFTKGRQIFIEGRLRFDQWEANSGEKRNKLTIVLEGFQFIDSVRDSQQNSEPSAYKSTSENTFKSEPAPAFTSSQTEDNDFSDEHEIPF